MPRPRAADEPATTAEGTPPDAAYAEAVALLRALSGPHGIAASRAAAANYGAVFARDAVMAGIAGLLAGSDAVAAGLARTLEGLRALQGARGQIASNYEPRGAGAARVSFGTAVPRLDAPAWYLVGIAVAARAGALDPAPFHESARAAARLLDAIEYNGSGLLYVPPGGDWADEYPYEGYVLHDQVLRAWALRLLAPVYDEPSWIETAARIERAVEGSFWPADAAEPGRPIAAHSPTRRTDRFDLAACALLALSGIAAPRGAAALEWTARRFLDRGALPPAFHPVVAEGDAEWPAMRRYHLHGFRNRPHEYHNGGIWPIWLGWLALALAGAARLSELDRLRALARPHLDPGAGWRFEEYLHGLTLAPGGVPEMAYSASGVVFLHLAGAPAARRLLGP